MVDINDVTTLIDKVLGIDIELDLQAADYNMDSKIDINDVVDLIERVLNGATSR